MNEAFYSSLTEHKGNSRLWLEGVRLEANGFEPGATYTPVYNIDRQELQLVLDPKGTHTVSSRKVPKSEQRKPIIDLVNAKIVETFGGGMRIRATFEKGLIRVTLHHEERARVEREQRLAAHLAEGRITEGSICFGIGVASHALSAGFEAAGLLQSSLEWVVELEQKYLMVAGKNNDVIGDNTRLICGSAEEVEADLITPVDAFQFSLPCVGHTPSGKSKNKNKLAEEHATGATALFGLIDIIRWANPSVLVSENVPEAQNSASYALLRSELVRRGYVVHEMVLDREQAGSLEQRRRYWFVAVSKGLDQFDMSLLPTYAPAHQSIADVLEPVADDNAAWAENTYLRDKAERDAAAGKGFKRQLLTPADTVVGTIGRHYMKRRSTEPFLTRADGKERLFTPVEHARLKRIPEHLIAGVPGTTAHEGLGQSILYHHAMGIGEALARSLCGTVAPVQTLTAEPVAVTPGIEANEPEMMPAAENTEQQYMLF